MPTQHDPKSLGKVTVAVSGTAVAVNAAAFVVKGVTFQSDPLNSGTYMLIEDVAGHIMARITKGQSFTPPVLGACDLSQFKLDSDTNGDGCYVTYV